MTSCTETTYRSARRPLRGWSLLNLIALRRQRRQLGQLDDRLLDDIGVTREEAETEARRPIWDAPSNWRE